MKKVNRSSNEDFATNQVLFLSKQNKMFETISDW